MRTSKSRSILGRWCYKCRTAYRGTQPAGCVVYNKSRVDIPPEAVDEGFIEDVEYFLGVIDCAEPAVKVRQETGHRSYR